MCEFTFPSRVLFALVCGAFAALSGTAALGQTAQHQFLQTLRPIPGVEVIFDPEEPFGENPSEFGREVAIRNGLAFVGMPLTFGTGRVAIFKQTTTGWVRSGTVTASDKAQGDEFGRAISFRNNLLVVGSKRAAYVYRQVNGVWQQQQKIAPPATDGIVTFAPDLKHEAGVLAIGAWGEHVVGARVADSVYIYEQDASGKFVRRARILSPSKSQDSFGASISMTDAIIVVGSNGAAYILARNTTGQWVSRQKLVPSNPAAAAGGFGNPVAVDRGMILVAAAGEFVPDPRGSEFDGVFGEVYGFLPGATKYVESFRLRPIARVPDFNFGMSIAISGNRIAVAALQTTGGEEAEDATVAIYSRVGSTVTSLGQIGSAGGRSVTLPTSIAIANNLLLVGSPFAGRCLFHDSCVGEAYLFRMDPTVD